MTDLRPALIQYLKKDYSAPFRSKYVPILYRLNQIASKKDKINIRSLFCRKCKIPIVVDNFRSTCCNRMIKNAS